jgi:hypothetical protein
MFKFVIASSPQAGVAIRRAGLLRRCAPRNDKEEYGVSLG